MSFIISKFVPKGCEIKILKDDEIVLFDTDKTKIENTLKFMPQYSDCALLENERKIENFQSADAKKICSAKSTGKTRKA